MRTLLTGAGGFVGSHVLRHLLARGDEVAVLLRPGANYPRLEGLHGFTTIDGDLEGTPSWEAAVTAWRPEVCIHPAWYAEPGKYLDSTRNLDALRAGLALLEVLARAGCRNIVMTGTCFEYDTDAGFLREDSPTKPLTLYAACKLALGTVAQQRAKQLGVNLAWGRIFYVYGPYEDTRRLIPALVLATLAGKDFPATKGDQVRDYTHIADVARGLAALAEPGCEGVFNGCAGEPVTMSHLMLTAARIVGRPELIKLGARPPAQFDPPFIAGDSRRIREATGWQPRFSLEEGLRQTVDWWRNR